MPPGWQFPTPGHVVALSETPGPVPSDLGSLFRRPHREVSLFSALDVTFTPRPYSAEQQEGKSFEDWVHDIWDTDAPVQANEASNEAVATEDEPHCANASGAHEPRIARPTPPPGLSNLPGHARFIGGFLGTEDENKQLLNAQAYLFLRYEFRRPTWEDDLANYREHYSPILRRVLVKTKHLGHTILVMGSAGFLETYGPWHSPSLPTWGLNVVHHKGHDLGLEVVLMAFYVALRLNPGLKCAVDWLLSGADLTKLKYLLKSNIDGRTLREPGIYTHSPSGQTPPTFHQGGDGNLLPIYMDQYKSYVGVSEDMGARYKSHATSGGVNQRVRELRRAIPLEAWDFSPVALFRDPQFPSRKVPRGILHMVEFMINAIFGFTDEGTGGLNVHVLDSFGYASKISSQAAIRLLRILDKLIEMYPDQRLPWSEDTHAWRQCLSAVLDDPQEVIPITIFHIVRGYVRPRILRLARVPHLCRYYDSLTRHGHRIAPITDTVPRSAEYNPRLRIVPVWNPNHPSHAIDRLTTRLADCAAIVDASVTDEPTRWEDLDSDMSEEEDLAEDTNVWEDEDGA